MVELTVLDEYGNSIVDKLDSLSPFTSHTKTRKKRDTDSKDLKNIKLNFKTLKTNVEVILNPLYRSIASTATIEWVDKNGSTGKPLQNGCLFEGTARNHTYSVGVFSLCSGIVSSIAFHYFINCFRSYHINNDNVDISFRHFFGFMYVCRAEFSVWTMRKCTLNQPRTFGETDIIHIRCIQNIPSDHNLLLPRKLVILLSKIRHAVTLRRTL